MGVLPSTPHQAHKALQVESLVHSALSVITGTFKCVASLASVAMLDIQFVTQQQKRITSLTHLLHAGE